MAEFVSRLSQSLPAGTKHAIITHNFATKNVIVEVFCEGVPVPHSVWVISRDEVEVFTPFPHIFDRVVVIA